MKRVIAFLGISPQKARYDFAGVAYEGFSFPEALRQFLSFDKMHVFVTPLARQKTLPALLDLKDPRIEAIDIPDGRDSNEMWEIFDKLVSVVDDGDTLIFDITHAFRSIPFFVMLALAYLKSAYENVRIERVLYGGLLFGDPAPVIDLTEFITLLDWMSATDQFVGFGNSQALVRLVKTAASSGSDAPADRLKLRQFAVSLDDVSRSLQLVMPNKAMIAGDELQQRLSAAKAPMQQRLRPFLPLADRVEKAYGPLALPDPTGPASVWRSLSIERDMVAWYLERQLLLQAIATAFEWLLSYGLAHLDYDDLYDGAAREEIRRHYSAYNKARKTPAANLRPDEARKAEVATDVLGNIPEYRQLLNLYEDAAHLRNDLMHATKTVHRERARRTPAQWEDDIRWVCGQLATFPLRE